MGLADALARLLDGVDLTEKQSAEALDDIVDGSPAPEVVSAFLVALRMKGETAEEVAGLASAMRERALPVKPSRTGLVDTCGTGGDGTGTMNISTAAAIVLAGAGLPVAKHGNRALSSRSGSADVLEALGVPLDLTPEQIARCIDEAGIGFLFAPALHPAMAAVMPVRHALGVRTVFNCLGPLLNPARPSFQLVGVGHPSLVDIVAEALAKLGIERALVVHGVGGADELTLEGPGIALLVEGGIVSRGTIGPEDAGLPKAPLEAIAGGTPPENAKALTALLDGRRGPVRDCVVLNAAAAFVAAGEAGDVREGAVRAATTIDDGSAGAALERLLKLVKTL